MLLSTLPYAAVCGLLYIMLSAHVIIQRGAARAAFGHNDSAPLNRAIRAHSNFNEYVPLGLLLMGLYEAAMNNPQYVQMMGTFLVIGRIIHAYSILIHEPRHNSMMLRAAGMMLTLTALTLAVIGLVKIWAAVNNI